MVSLKRKVYDFAVNGLIPKTPQGDRFLSFLIFLYSHKRLPKKDSLLFNDCLYFLKTGREIKEPLREFVTDKEYVKIYIKSMVGDKYNVPTLAVFKSKRDACEFVSEGRVCAKPTHLTKQVAFLERGQSLDSDLVDLWFALNQYNVTRERNYKNLTPKVIVEPLIFDDNDLDDYRFFCFNGKPRLLLVDKGKYSRYRRCFFDMNGNPLDFSLKYPHDGSITLPGNFEEMKFVAEKLAKCFSFIRVDIYSNGSQMFVGELTNCHAGGNQRFHPVTSEKQASEIIFQNLYMT